MSLIDNLIQQGHLKTDEIIKAFKKIKREDFVLAEDRRVAEANAPLAIGFGQTISQPLTVAVMFEMLKPKRGDKILDVGCGSGWTTALLAEIVGDRGEVYGLEIISDLKNLAERNVSKYNFISQGTVKVIRADGRKPLLQSAYFDKILVSAAAREVPESLLKQLKIGGRLVIPIGKQYASQELAVIDKTGKRDFKEKRHPGYIFVPLVKE